MVDIYKHTCIITGKSYIGYSKHGITKRWKAHVVNALKYNAKTHFHNAIRKYLPESFTHEILYQTNSTIEAQSVEKFYISWYNSLSNGYNMTNGGDGGNTNGGKTLGPRPSVAGSNNPFFGKSHSPELIKQITTNSKITKSKNPEKYKGWCHTEECKLAMSNNRTSNPKYALPHSQETKKK